jgi:hypothetical protein
MSAYLAPSLVRLRAEINARWPNRSKVSDGWIGDPAHGKRVSDHNPDPASSPPGIVRALDVTVGGIDRKALIRDLIKHPATRYVISDGVIYSRRYGFAPRAYTGSNPHRTHVHVSILQTPAAASSRARWLTPVRSPSLPPLPRYAGPSGFRRGAKGEQVRVAQAAVGRPINGVMDNDDVAAIRRWQRRRPWLWPADGIVGPKTYRSFAASSRVKSRWR